MIGAGAAGSVFVKKALQDPKTFSEIHVASRTLAKCETLKKECNDKISIYSLDADNTDDVIALIKQISPKLVVNLALPYQDLSIMDACLATGVNYLDTANYEPKDEAKFCYKWQWDYQERFEDAGLMALLGCGFDPGVTNAYSAYALKHEFDSIETIDILDCNAGNHGHPFATNFNPEINIREITQKGKYFEDGKWIEIPAMSQHRDFDFPEVGVKRAYLMYHEELESLAKHIPGVKSLKFWMTFSEQYINYLNVLQDVGMTSISPINFEGKEIVPLQFLKAVLPNPQDLAKNYEGRTSIGCLVKGLKDGKEKTIFIYNSCDHQVSYSDVGAQAVSYTTGVPAVAGAKLMLNGAWNVNGVVNVEQLDPDPFLSELNKIGLPWTIKTF